MKFLTKEIEDWFKSEKKEYDSLYCHLFADDQNKMHDLEMLEKASLARITERGTKYNGRMAAVRI